MREFLSRNINQKKINEIINNLQLNSPFICKDLNFVDKLNEDEVLSFLVKI